MTSHVTRLARGVALLAAMGLVASCGLPRSGPNKGEIFSGSVLEEGDAFILTVNDRINRIAGVTPAAVSLLLIHLKKRSLKQSA